MIIQRLKKFRSKQIFTGLLLVGMTIPSLVYAQSSNAHHQDYLAALNIAAEAETRIVSAMQQVQSGQVAHYDFLQNEHIELIRQSRALAWPPSDISSPNKDALRKDAQALLSSAEALEWVIADYLRAFAQVRSATSNTLDIADQASLHATSDLKGLLATLKGETQAFAASAYQNDQDSLTQAYDAVLNSDISQQSHRELQFQKERIFVFTPQLQTHMQALLASEVDVQAAHLKALYEEAI